MQGIDYFNVLAVVFVLGGLYYGLKAIRCYAWVARSRRWRPTAGRVLESRVQEVVLGRGRIGVSRVFLPLVRYQYEAGGVLRESTRLDVSGWLYPTRERAERVSARFVAGAEVVVRYDPADPGRACLAGRPLAAWPYALGSVALIVLGLLQVLRGV